MARILLLDSDQVLAGNLVRFFKASGHRVRWQVEPQAAINSVDNFKPELIILDLLLAERSGAEFLYELRSYPDWESLPVIIYSCVDASGLGQFAPQGLDHLNIGAFHYKNSTSLAELDRSLNRLLQPTTA